MIVSDSALFSPVSVISFPAQLVAPLGGRVDGLHDGVGQPVPLQGPEGGDGRPGRRADVVLQDGRVLPSVKDHLARADLKIVIVCDNASALSITTSTRIMCAKVLITKL